MLIDEHDSIIPHIPNEALGNGILRKNSGNIHVDWESQNIFDDDLHEVTEKIRGAVLCFFRELHLHQTHRPPAPEFRPTIHKPERIYVPSPLDDSSPLRPKVKPTHETIRPPSPLRTDISGVIITPEGMLS